MCILGGFEAVDWVHERNVFFRSVAVDAAPSVANQSQFVGVAPCAHIRVFRMDTSFLEGPSVFPFVEGEVLLVYLYELGRHDIIIGVSLLHSIGILGHLEQILRLVLKLFLFDFGLFLSAGRVINCFFGKFCVCLNFLFVGFSNLLGKYFKISLGVNYLIHFFLAFEILYEFEEELLSVRPSMSSITCSDVLLDLVPVFAIH